MGLTGVHQAEIIALIRKIPGIMWSPEQGCWYLSLSRVNFDKISSCLSGTCNLDITVLKNYLDQKKAFAERDDSIQRSHQPVERIVLSDENQAAYNRFRDMLTLRGYSPKTLKVYANEFHSLLRILGHHTVVSLSRENLQGYLLWLIQNKKYSEAHIHTAINAIKFFFEKVEGRESEFYDLPRPKKPSKLPDILAAQEIIDLIQKTENIKHRTLIMTSYSAGLRVSELVGLKIQDIDSKRMMIHIRGAKGKKDRMVPLSVKLLDMLREYFRLYRPRVFLFEGEQGGSYSVRSAQIVISQAKKRAGILKKGGVHMLRHAFATHLLESGIDIRFIQEFLGHHNLQTTMIYTHVSKKSIKGIQSPLDGLDF